MTASSTTTRVGGGIWREVPLLNDEAVVKQGAAWHRARPLHRAWGQLFLTNKRLIYCPTKVAVPWRDEPLAYSLEEITALGRTKRPWYWTVLLWAMAPDTLFIEVKGKRHWFSLGWGWNKYWLKELADRTGLTPTDEG
jgi:hypothetical protein